MFKLFRIILRRDLMLAFRRKSDLAQVIFFFAVVVTLVPLVVGFYLGFFAVSYTHLTLQTICSV